MSAKTIPAAVHRLRWATGIPIAMLDSAVLARNRVTHSRHGASASKPRCDGGHTEAEFRDCSAP